jgi:hypothetical protein
MKIINEPQTISLAEYNDQIEKYKNRVSSIGGVQSVYLMGSIKAPGLSDVDLIVVVDDDFKSSLSGELSVSGLDPRIFLHGPVVVPISLSKRLQEIVYASNLSCIYGYDCLQRWEDVGGDVKKYLSVCYLIDFLESRFLQSASIKDFPVDKRSWLTRIWSTTHSVFLYESLTNEEIPLNYKKIMTDVKLTREKWLSEGRVDDGDFLSGLIASENINEFIFNNVLDLFYGGATLKSDFHLSSGAKIFRFINSVESPVYNYRSIKFLEKKFSVYDCVHGPKYLAHLAGYFPLDIDWDKPPYFNEKLEKVKKQRSEAITSHSLWLNKHVPQSKSMKGYLGIDRVNDETVRGHVKKIIAWLIT